MGGKNQKVSIYLVFQVRIKNQDNEKIQLPVYNNVTGTTTYISKHRIREINFKLP